ncbi:hypothetical protein L1887_00470 [Cichorium endivia]|nr:hypothetical protein L1887_00470 [Cichorium endivia]
MNLEKFVYQFCYLSCGYSLVSCCKLTMAFTKIGNADDCLYRRNCSYSHPHLCLPHSDVAITAMLLLYF